ncbi:rhomboid-like protein 14, mitochondrial [Selaginella moellendorffii]|uniref:rhomboid-like protein 14, mitochondrial n=1 Tax=Selaginella moellendorffii TaxID=88036 RepID=UPI000D1CA74E|nr:rhomboid-like protein 14, mitochondrial [Selaginella moellendorffii]|eukprot:XP_002966977.2 rhomboid-like protein 14, mitochondrial [Selaginella moellendorffii]
MAGRRGGRSNGMLLMLALHVFSQFVQLERKPPVTAALILANVIVYLRPGSLHEVLPSIEEVCLSPYLVLRNFDVKRLLLSAFYHVDEAHLFYNMISLLWKGVQLEGRMGSPKFASMVALLLGMSHGLMVLLGTLVSTLTDSPAPYTSCAVGFSALLFALKVVLNHNSPANAIVYGFVVPARFAAWAELVLVQMFMPGASFLGHLSGILAGLLYVRAPRFFSSGIGALVRRSANWSWMVTRPLWFLLGRPSPPPSRRFGGGSVGSRNEGGGSGGGLSFQMWRCRACTYENWEPADSCEMCGTPRSGGGNSSFSPTAPPWPQHEPLPGSPQTSAEAIRQARIARFTR